MLCEWQFLYTIGLKNHAKTQNYIINLWFKNTSYKSEAVGFSNDKSKTDFQNVK